MSIQGHYQETVRNLFFIYLIPCMFFVAWLPCLNQPMHYFFEMDNGKRLAEYIRGNKRVQKSYRLPWSRGRIKQLCLTPQSLAQKSLELIRWPIFSVMVKATCNSFCEMCWKILRFRSNQTFHQVVNTAPKICFLKARDLKELRESHHSVVLRFEPMHFFHIKLITSQSHKIHCLPK